MDDANDFSPFINEEHIQGDFCVFHPEAVVCEPPHEEEHSTAIGESFAKHQPSFPLPGGLREFHHDGETLARLGRQVHGGRSSKVSSGRSGRFRSLLWGLGLGRAWIVCSECAEED